MQAMAAIPILFGTVGGSIASLVAGGPKVPTPPPPITLNDAQAAQNQQDALLTRRGGASDFLNGDSGATPTMPGPKQLLGS